MKKVLVIHGEGNTFNNPSLKAIIDLLGSRGYQCHIRYASSPAPMPSYPNIVQLPYGWFLRKVKRWTYDRLCSRWLARLFVSIEDIAIYPEFDLILAVDRLGLIEAAILSKRHGTPFVFISFEIMFADETSRRFKRIERLSARNCCFWIVQDEVRAACLVEENALDIENSFILPLASAGPGVFPAMRLRDQMGIPKNYSVAVLIGSLTTWSMAKETIESVRDWPPDWALLVHERYGNTESALNRLGVSAHELSDRIYFSGQAPDRVDDLGYVLEGVSAGLAFYRPTHDSIYTGKNLEYLGFASGKVSTYLRYGIPVICNEIGLYAQQVRAHDFGVVVAHPSQIAQALPLTSEPTTMSPSRYFADFLDFNLRSSELLHRFEQCMAAPCGCEPPSSIEDRICAD
ncbi:glycosyltransferase family 4 protein [Thermomonas sp. HDW16]|uniref:glycosyltransferase family 4 protein n=1 Tax=Thermomonas sp. HDW16 TaxID=2714945 RepID=UPI00140A035F|nr:glycosyltransferase family 4 protein [Thermomonas sp. HDW16]QIL21428.1 glycosyltransferase family 4 protein [Thermomonas sp. HDW16]